MDRYDALKLNLDMSAAQVEAVLGQPGRTELASPDQIMWIYSEQSDQGPEEIVVSLIFDPAVDVPARPLPTSDVTRARSGVLNPGDHQPILLTDPDGEWDAIYLKRNPPILRVILWKG